MFSSRHSRNISDPSFKNGHAEPDTLEHAVGLDIQFNDNTLAIASTKEKGIDTLQAIRIHRNAFLWCLWVSIGCLLWGYDVQVSSGLLSAPYFRHDFGYKFGDEYVVPARWQSAFNSVGSIGGMFGGIAVGWIADHIGRRGSIGIACLISIMSIFIQFFCPPHKNALLLVGKLINGVSLGMYISSSSAYCAEISPVTLRGITTGCVNLWILIFSAIQWIFPVILLIGLPFAPESPWYLARKGLEHKSRRVLAVLGIADVDLHYRQIQETIVLEDHYASEATYWQCFKGTNRRRTIIALMVFILQQIVGVIFVLGYSTYFFQLAGFEISQSFKLGVGVTAIGVAGNLSALYSVDKFGRRPLFLSGMIGCTAINFGIGFSSISNTEGARWAEAIFGYVSTLFAECWPISSYHEANLKGRVGYIFGGLGLVGSIWTWLYIPETKNRTVDE
ncbi:uncharacterized protein L201_004951 [Kwoniella dendrophila CBS 6074]|uniref:Major facilitator superfamily (MFS) profile domain-containing protein n=1 Tax=Kwoniella dendrophila CBS 6074 TaxID=1295534 RepID=A0AAX4JXS0_9TREE